ncbi:MAG: cobalt ECF transporter T component CbiQ [Anaerolineales bacterium]|nr:cobalt ECF transporter T component CbiQ [Anaerolineales bacterium]
MASARGAIERTLAEIGHVLEQSLFAETLSRQPGLLQALDPRVKIVGLLALLVSVSVSRNLWVIGGLYGVALALAVVSRLPVGAFVRRVWLVLPFFTGMVALPALFMTPGPTLWSLPFDWVITRTGALTALFLLTRVGTSVSFALLLIWTTPWNTLLKALSVLRVPDGFILILAMTYRYIALLLGIVDDMFLSRKSRVVGKLSTADERRLLAASAGALLGRSLQLSTEVYLAMQSRGYRGRPRTLDTFAMTARDWAWSFGLVALAAVAMVVGQVGG